MPLSEVPLSEDRKSLGGMSDPTGKSRKSFITTNQEDESEEELKKPDKKPVYKKVNAYAKEIQQNYEKKSRILP